MLTLAWAIIGAALGFIAGIVAAWLIMRRETGFAYDDGYADGRAEEYAAAERFDQFEATALAPLPDPDGFSEPEQEWDDKALAALRDDAPEPYRFTPEPRPAEHERLTVPHDLHWPDPDLASQLALLDAREAVELAAAARLRVELTDSIPAVQP